MNSLCEGVGTICGSWGGGVILWRWSGATRNLAAEYEAEIESLVPDMVKILARLFRELFDGFESERKKYRTEASRPYGTGP